MSHPAVAQTQNKNKYSNKGSIGLSFHNFARVASAESAEKQGFRASSDISLLPKRLLYASFQPFLFLQAFLKEDGQTENLSLNILQKWL